MTFSKRQVKILNRAGLVTSKQVRADTIIKLCMRVAWALQACPHAQLPRGYRIASVEKQLPYLILTRESVRELHINPSNHSLGHYQAQIVIYDLLSGWLQEIRQFLQVLRSKLTWPKIPLFDEDEHKISYIDGCLRGLNELMKELGM